MATTLYPTPSTSNRRFPSTFPLELARLTLQEPFNLLSSYINIHTHVHPRGEGEATLPSLGLHPWHLTPDWQEQLAAIEAQLTTAPTATLIGECGLDRACTTPYDLQLAAFQAQIALSERLQKPLILHCVRAIDDVLHLYRGTRQPWIWHGFRGKPQQLQQLITHGFYISFGFLHNADSLRACPRQRLFLETDEDPRPIALLYESAATLRSTTVEALNHQLWDNTQALFHNNPTRLS